MPVSQNSSYTWGRTWLVVDVLVAVIAMVGVEAARASTTLAGVEAADVNGGCLRDTYHPQAYVPTVTPKKG